MPSRAGRPFSLGVLASIRIDQVFPDCGLQKSLGIGYETVKEHVRHILRKVGVSDRTQAAV
jgi:hypothetical protein